MATEPTDAQMAAYKMRWSARREFKLDSDWIERRSLPDQEQPLAIFHYEKNTGTLTLSVYGETPMDAMARLDKACDPVNLNEHLKALELVDLPKGKGFHL